VPASAFFRSHLAAELSMAVLDDLTRLIGGGAVMRNFKGIPIFHGDACVICTGWLVY
jgi:hypothetical protein